MDLIERSPSLGESSNVGSSVALEAAGWLSRGAVVPFAQNNSLHLLPTKSSNVLVAAG